MINKPLALIVDDEADIRELIQLTLSRLDIEVAPAANLAQARLCLAQLPIRFCLTDLRLPDGDGLALVKEMNQHYPDIPVAVFTAHGHMEAAVEAMKLGAFDFVSKPVDLKILRDLVNTALRLVKDQETNGLRPCNMAGYQTLLGYSESMLHVRTMVEKLARTQAPVFISGESGTGKELAARAIHQASPRSEHEFVPVNCGAIPQELMESEFFGHRKGSFTGALADKPGLFKTAEGGTLFLDEIADLPVSMQVKLLRAIQEKSIRPIGAPREVPVDVRIISATHRDLDQMVQEGSFRKDLYYRINVIRLPMPALRERPEDIPLLVQHILDRIASQTGLARPIMTAPALRSLCAQPFPGNIRELENILERAVVMCENQCIQLSDLQLIDCRTSLPASVAASPGRTSQVSPRGDQPLETFLEDLERQAILEALEATRWNRTAAAERLGMSFRSLRYRLSKLKLEKP